MYRINTPAVYIHQRVLDSPQCVARMERMLPHIASAQAPRVVDDAELAAISREGNWIGEVSSKKRLGFHERSGDPTIVFNRFRWCDADTMEGLKKSYPDLRSIYLLGDGAFTFSNGRATLETQHGVCQDAHILHSAWGCLHRCDYCNVGSVFNIMLDIEEMIEHLDALVQANPQQQLYKYDNHTDIPTLEPEYGALKLLVDYFARQSDRYLLIYTKSHNLAYLADYDHRGHTIVCWTLSCEQVSREIEKQTPSMQQRIDSMVLCQAAGYSVRARLSPIIPVRGWREQNAEMLEAYLTAVTPDVVTLDMFKHVEPRDVRDTFDVSIWDPEFAETVDRYAGLPFEQRPFDVIPNGKQMFPHTMRADVYRFFAAHIARLSPSTRTALCGETPEMWQELHTELGMTPEDYVCACGPNSVPGNSMLCPGANSRGSGVCHQD